MFACEKETNDEPLNNSYRIKQIVFNDNGDNSSTTVFFSYENEKLSTVDYYHSENGLVAVQICKSDIKYSGNDVSQLFTYSTEEIFWDEIDEMDYVFENDLILEISNSRLLNSLWEEHGRKTFQYSDKRLISDKLFSTSEQIGKTDYSYEGNNLTEIEKWMIVDDMWVELGKEKFNYIDNKISYIEQIYNSPIGWEPTQKMEYTYTGEKLSKVAFYFWDLNSNSWVNDDSYYSFTYNNDGYVIETSDTGEAAVTYQYEIGKGNADTFISPDISLYNFPAHLGIFYMPF